MVFAVLPGTAQLPGTGERVQATQQRPRELRSCTAAHWSTALRTKQRCSALSLQSSFAQRRPLTLAASKTGSTFRERVLESGHSHVSLSPAADARPGASVK
jgi:hypothetical protein